MFGIGSTELLLILVVALIVLGPKSLAGVSRSLGKAMGEFRRVSTEFQRTLNMEAARQEVRDAETRRNHAQAQPETAENCHSTGDSHQTAESIVPDDSPVGQAIAKARAQASATSVNQPPRA